METVLTHQTIQTLLGINKNVMYTIEIRLYQLEQIV